MISYVVDENLKIRLLTIDAKSHQADISETEILSTLRKEGML